MRRGKLTNAPNKHRIALPFGAERSEARAITGGVETFLELNDTPHEYKSEAGKWVKVKDDEKGLEFGHPNLGITYTVTLVSLIIALLCGPVFANVGGAFQSHTVPGPTFTNTGGVLQSHVMPNPVLDDNTILFRSVGLGNPSFDNNDYGTQQLSLTHPTVEELSQA